MTSFLVKRVGDALFPVDARDADQLRQLEQGRWLQIDPKQRRNPQQHRLWWALVAKVFDNQEEYGTKEELVAALKVKAGACTYLVLGDGTRVAIPNSIKYASMDQAEFREFFDRTVDFICSEVIPGLGNAELEREVNQMLESKHPAWSHR